MKEYKKWPRILFIVGVVLLITCAVDPLEGSVLIVAGSFLMAFSSFFSLDRHRKLFSILFFVMIFGVFFLFYLSSFGGLGKDGLSWWYGILIIPYPAAWLGTIILLIFRAFKKT